MSKQYGLIIPKTSGHKVQDIVARPSIFGEDSDSDTEVAKPTGLKKTVKKQDKLNQEKAVVEDPTVFQYDEIYDEMDQKRKESKLSRKDLDKKPKYISRLMVAADRRKRENERRIERQVQKEREAEGEEFKDKESFVTSSYRKKLEEMKELEEQEKREEYLESIGDVKKQGNLDGFYRHLYDQKVNFREDKAEVKEEVKSDDAADNPGKKRRSSTEKGEKTPDKLEVKKRRYRKRNDAQNSADETSDLEVEVKKEHLPSNLDADSDFSIDSSDSEDDGKEKTTEKTEKLDKIVENKTALDKNEAEKPEVDSVVENGGNKEEKLSIEDKEVKEEKVVKPRVDIWKKRTVGDVFDEALKRYFERKSLRESGY